MLSLIDLWNRKLHYYCGLYLVLFLWLFAVSGLLLNHSKWRSANFWSERKQEREERKVQLVTGVSDLEQAKNLMRQLPVAGEIEWTAPQQPPGRLEFRVARPGRIVTISADASTGVASVESITVNGWGIVNMLHSFTGVRSGRPEVTRDWWATRLWSFSMDAVCGGTMFMVLSGYWVWYRGGRRRVAGLVALAAGLAACGFFLFGLS